MTSLSDSEREAAKKAAKRKWQEDNREHVLALNRAYYARNKEAQQARVREYQKNNAESVAKTKAEYAKKHPEQTRNARRARRAAERAAPSEFWDNAMIISIYGSACHICFQEIDLDAPTHPSKPGWQNGFHPDHLIPLCKGGSNLIENIRPSHALCNMRKNRS